MNIVYFLLFGPNEIYLSLIEIVVSKTQFCVPRSNLFHSVMTSEKKVLQVFFSAVNVIGCVAEVWNGCNKAMDIIFMDSVLKSLVK